MPETESIVPRPCCGTFCAASPAGPGNVTPEKLVKEAGAHRCSYDGQDYRYHKGHQRHEQAVLDTLAARHPPRDVAPDKECYEQRQEHPYETRHASSCGGRTTTQSGEDGAQYQADPQRDNPANDDAGPARSQLYSLAHPVST